MQFAVAWQERLNCWKLTSAPGLAWSPLPILECGYCLRYRLQFVAIECWVCIVLLHMQLRIVLPPHVTSEELTIWTLTIGEVLPLGSLLSSALGDGPLGRDRLFCSATWHLKTSWSIIMHRELFILPQDAKAMLIQASKSFMSQLMLGADLSQKGSLLQERYEARMQLSLFHWILWICCSLLKIAECKSEYKLCRGKSCRSKAPSKRTKRGSCRWRSFGNEIWAVTLMQHCPQQ